MEEDEGDAEVGNWIHKLPLGGRAAIKAWSKSLAGKKDHQPIAEEVRIDDKLADGRVSA